MQVRTGLGTGHSVTAVRPAGKRWAVTAGELVVGDLADEQAAK